MSRIKWFAAMIGCLAVSSVATGASCSNTSASNGWVCVISTSGVLGSNGGSTTGVTTSGNLLVFAEAEYGGGGSPTTPCTPSDTINGGASGNTWTLAGTTIDGSVVQRVSIWYINGHPKTGINHVVTCTATGVFSSGALFAFSRAIMPVDQQNGNSFIGTTVQPGSVTPSANLPLLITIAGSTNGSTNTWTSIDSSFTIAESVSGASGVNVSLAVAYLTQTTAAAVNPTWTNNASGNTATRIATFRTAPALFSLLGIGR